MSTPPSNGLAAPSTSSLPRPPTATGSQTQLPTVTNKPKLVPTNSVTLKDGTTVRARIEATLAVEDVIRQLCISVKIKDPPSKYALRDENDELVTNENLKKKIKGKVNLKYAGFLLGSYYESVIYLHCVDSSIRRPSKLKRLSKSLAGGIRGWALP